jgi:hypothetical protein
MRDSIMDRSDGWWQVVMAVERAGNAVVTDGGHGAVMAGSADDPGPEIGLTGARFGGAPRRRRESPAPAPELPAVPIALPALHDPGPSPEPSRYTIVRPYVLTGGRTRGHVDFAVEALVTTVPRPARPGEPVEHTRIRELCRAPRSVAEVAALLGTPLGVARVLLADLLAGGAVTVHRTADAGGPDLALMERVLFGLRRL